MPRLKPEHTPINPPAAAGLRGRELPAYVSNGLIGLRVRETPLRAGMCIVSGFTGQHHERRVEATAAAPYPLAGDLALDGVWMDDQIEGVEPIDQAYEFSTAELTSRFAVRLGARRAEVEVLTFASRSHPSVVCQETTVVVDGACELTLRARVDTRSVRGRPVERRLDTPGEAEPVCDGTILWASEGEEGFCGLALRTEGPDGAVRTQEPWDAAGPLSTTYRLQAAKGRRYRLRQLVSLVPDVMHHQPHRQATRLIAEAGERGFETLRRLNREAWADIWRGRIRLVGAGDRWQALADAAVFYLASSTHASSPASTSIYGLSSWWNYHYYLGHVMWDVDAFATPPLSVLQPDAARALLDFRSRGLAAARMNAKLQGRRGVRFPWEAGPGRGEEATPGGASGAAREDHVNLHVARAFSLFADISGDERFLREQAWPVLAGVSDWVVDRVTPGRDGYDWRRMGGPAERAEPVDNDALTRMAAKVVLERAAEAARQLGYADAPGWMEAARGLAPPLRSDGAIAQHDAYAVDEEQGATPAPLMALFPYWAEVDAATARRTLELYLGLWEGYVGAPMLAALYGVWACWLGDRRLALKLYEEGYGAYQTGRFAQTLEYRLDKVPDGVASGPFIANIGGFLTGLLFGLPGLKASSADPAAWACRPVVLPQGWAAIECDRLWVRGRPHRLVARHGAERAELTAA